MPSMTEQWSKIPGFPDYEVSDSGSVRSWKQARGLPVPHELAGGSERDWRYVTLQRPEGGQSTFRVHRLVAEAFLGPCPDGMEIRHLDGQRDNNAVSNLSYGTSSENTRDAIGHGTHNNARKTHCKHGHPYNEANTRIRPDGRGRDCRACNRERARRNYANHKRV